MKAEHPMTPEEELHTLRARIAALEAERDRMLPIYTAHLAEETCVAERRERERLRVAALTERELHCEQRHPDYEYLTTENARKQSGGDPPENEGWEPNAIVECHLYKDGVVVEERWCNWTRGEYTETNYWRRKKPTQEQS